MFTGIIEKTATVSSADSSTGGMALRLSVARKLANESDPYFRSPFQEGESIAVNGVCLTLTRGFPAGEELEFYVSPETLACTTFGQLAEGHVVNLERAMALGDRFSGHWVQGHVDGVGQVASVQAVGDSWRVVVAIPQALARFAVPKGSITIQGVSLTINAIVGVEVSLMIIPHTWKNTHFHAIKPGDFLNLEMDLIPKTLERLCQPYLQPKP